MTTPPETIQEAGEETPLTAGQALEKLIAVTQATSGDAAVQKLKEKLKNFKPPSAQKTISGSEDPDAKQNPAADEPPKRLTGRNVDWSEYNLNYNVAHLYSQAEFRETPQGPKWCAMATDFWSTTKNFKSHGQKNNVPGTNDGTETEPLNLGEYLNDMVNGREQWKIAAVMPGPSGQCGLLLERQVPIILPDPQPLKKKEEVEAPTEPELQTVEDAVLAFMAENNSIGLCPIERGTAEHEAALAQLDDDGALPERRTTNVSKALDLNAATTAAPPVPKGIQPAAVENPIIAGPQAAHGYAAAQDILRALTDPEYRKSLPTEE